MKVIILDKTGERQTDFHSLESLIGYIHLVGKVTIEVVDIDKEPMIQVSAS